MLNTTRKFIVYLDAGTLEYMYLTYTEKRNYPVMRKLFTLLRDGYQSDLIVTPLSHDHLYPYIEDNKIDTKFLGMMSEIGQLQFLQRFTVKMLQLIRVINSFFGQVYKKEIWKDAFSSDPDERYNPGFSKYHSITAQNIITALDREKKLSQVFDFVEKYKLGQSIEALAEDYYRYIFEQFPDIISQYLPADGNPEDHINTFLTNNDIKDIPEFHIISNTLYPLFESYGVQDVEFGLKDDVILAAETAASYMPYCHFYVTVSDIAEMYIMTGINDIYNVKVYDNNESSLYKLMEDIRKSLQQKMESRQKESGKSMFQRDNNRRFY